MTRTILLALTLLASAAWMQAQSQYPQSSSSQSGTSESSGQASGQATVQGCLQGSSGSFTLTSDSGTTYQLQGDTSKLSKHVGHEVAITGSASAAGASTPSSATSPSSTSAGASTSAGTSGSSQTLNVEKVKHISETCKASK